MTIKEQLKGTCVLNEKEGMGAEIVALYTEAGIENDEALVGDCIGEYYGERDGIIDNQVSKEYFQTILTLSQLREIVSTPEYKEPIKWSFASELYEAPKEWQDEFKKANPDMKHSEEPQFKAGDVVEVSNNGIDWDKYSHHTHKYSGAKRMYDGHFIVENQDGFICTHKFIRHPKDKIREKAEEMLNGSFRYQSIDKRRWIVEEDVKEMLTEAIKWGQENK